MLFFTVFFKRIWLKFSGAVVVASALTVVCGLAPVAYAQDDHDAQEDAPQTTLADDEIKDIADDEIKDIEVVGTGRIGADSVEVHTGLQVGDVFSEENLDAALKSLYRTGFYRDVHLGRRDDTLVVTVVENPVINQIAFEGNRRIDDAQLAREVSLDPRSVYTRAKVRTATHRILQLYHRSGRFTASVVPKIIVLEGGRVDLVFEIVEGPLTKIRSIVFVGNKVFTDGELKKVIFSREEKWWNILTSLDRYDPDRVNFDRDQLRSFYLQKGYLDFRVESLVSELDEEAQQFIITFSLSEGERYRYGDISIESAFSNLPRALLESAISIDSGEWYNARQVENVREELIRSMGESGYAFVNILFDPVKHSESGTADITFEITQGIKAFIEEIDISGNPRTLDEVVRREFRLVEGDAYNVSLLAISRSRILDLDYFSRVDVDLTQGSREDWLVVETKVEEKPTGSLQIGAGYASDQGTLFNVQVQERNLLGRGLILSGGADFYAKGDAKYSVFFADPYFLDRRVYASVGASYEKDQSDETMQKDETIGFSTSIGFNYTELLSQSFRYGLDKIRLSTKKSAISRVLALEVGSHTKSTIGTRLTYDVRDSRLNPRTGYYTSADLEVAGMLFGDSKYIKTVLSGGYYQPVLEESFGDLTLALEAEVGQISGIRGAKTRIADRFFLGGQKVRGFREFGISPRELPNKEPLGGRYFYLGTAELRFPLGLPEEYNVRGRFFLDAGATWQPDIPKSLSNLKYTNDKDPRLSTGMGFTWYSPVGAISLDVARPLIKKTGDRTRSVQITFGGVF